MSLGSVLLFGAMTACGPHINTNREEEAHVSAASQVSGQWEQDCEEGSLSGSSRRSIVIEENRLEERLTDYSYSGCTGPVVQTEVLREGFLEVRADENESGFNPNNGSFHLEDQDGFMTYTRFAFGSSEQGDTLSLGSEWVENHEDTRSLELTILYRRF